MNKLFDEVIDKDLCLKCGTCIGVCPNNAISIESKENPIPVIDEDKCTHCGLCYDSCPGIQVDFRKLEEQFQGRESENYLGVYNKSFIFDGSDAEGSSSGGFVTEFLKYVLEEDIVMW